jgi:hypothetical protein
MNLSLGFGLDKYRVQDATLLNQIPSFDFAPIVDDRVRTANNVRTFAGTTRMVGTGQTYATISAAYSAASAGDIIQLIDGTYDMASESGGYLLLGTAAKRIRIQGNATDRTAVILTSAGSSFVIRKNATVETVFKDLTISISGNTTAVYEDTDNDNAITVFDNCVLKATNTGSSTIIYKYNDSYLTRNRWIEFKNCQIEQAGAANPIQVPGISATKKLLITGGSITNTSTTAATMLIQNLVGGVCIYDCTISQAASTYILRFGTDSVAPTATLGLIDIRGCDIKYTGAAYGHGVLLGRGTNNIYFVNNKITTPNTNNSGNIGLVIKNVSTTLANAVIKGNWIKSIRPIQLKGGAYNDIQFNTFISNDAYYFAVGIDNDLQVVDLNSQYNKIENNIFYSQTVNLFLSSATAESAKTSMLTGTLDNNKYCTDSGNYLNDSTNIVFANRAAYWGNAFDANSQFFTGVTQP